MRALDPAIASVACSLLRQASTYCLRNGMGLMSMKINALISEIEIESKRTRLMSIWEE